MRGHMRILFPEYIADAGTGVRVQEGLTDLRATTIPLHRIQALELVQPLWWRPLGWWRIRVNVAGSGSNARRLADGEIEYRRGNYEVAFAHLRRSVELDDALPYDEPWGWMQPTRHALGALLLEQGRVAEAEAIYRSDLGLDGKLSRACQHPDNLWSLHGLHECLNRRGETVEAALIKQRLDLALARSEVPVKASCFCRMKVAA